MNLGFAKISNAGQSLFFLFAFAVFADFSQVYEMPISDYDPTSSEVVWEIVPAAPFDEAILSWNAPRTADSQYTFFVSLRQGGKWSPWLFYGDWGKTGQMLPMESFIDSFAETNRGIARCKQGICDGLRVQIHAIGNEKLRGLKFLSATLSNLSKFQSSPSFSHPTLHSVLLQDVPRQSVYTLRLDRHWDMTMVAAMLSAIQYLSKNEIDIENFVSYIMDNDFESFDFWPHNAAEAFHRLGGKYRIHTQRLANFAELHSYLLKGTPVIVNIQGTPAGGILWPPYRSHILCVIGYDSLEDKVICLDPIFPNNKSTYIAYPLDSFLTTWARRKNIALVFEKRSY